MIDRLHEALEHLPPEAQEEAAAYIETLIHSTMLHAQSGEILRQDLNNVPWQNPFGAWRDLPDTIFDDLDQLRHSNQPTPPLEL